MTSAPPDTYSDVRFTDQLDGSASENRVLRNVTAVAMPSGTKLGVNSVDPLPGKERALRIVFQTAPAPGDNLVSVCFGQVHFLDPSKTTHSTANLCGQASILTPENAESHLKNLIDGLVRSASPTVKRSIDVHNAILDPDTASDAFGRRISRRYIVVEVVVANRSKDFDFLVHNISVKVPVNLVAADVPAGGNEYVEFSSVELTLLRGVAEHGQLTDPRNIVDRSLKALGTVAGGIIGVTRFPKDFAPAVAFFNGPLISAYENMFPDYTINQLNRINDSAYVANKLISKQQARVIVVFMPQAYLMNKAEQSAFIKEPRGLLERLLTKGKIQVLVDGVMITEVQDINPQITTVAFGQDVKHFQDDKPEVKGHILGQFLADATLSLGSKSPAGMTIEIDGTPTETQINFILKADKPVPPNTAIDIVVHKGSLTTTSTVTAQYSPDAPAITKLAPASVKQGETKEITVTGTGFLPDKSTVTIVAGGLDVAVVDGKTAVDSATTLRFTVKVADTAVAKAYNVMVTTPGGPSPGGTSSSLTVAAK